MNDLYEALKHSRFVISGPCVLEDYNKSLEIASTISSICNKYGFVYIFKGSFDKANRTSVSSYRGVGISDGFNILSKIRNQFYTTTDIHVPDHAEKISDAVDIIQIPAFLSRQTDLIVSAAKTNKIVNIKKFQLLSGLDMAGQIEKVNSVGNNKIMLTERGTMFPYGNLIVDLRNLVDMNSFGYPVIMDCTHACQSLVSGAMTTSGRKDMAPIYAKAAAICGVKGFFAEVYPDPDKAPSDSSTSLSFDEFEDLISGVSKI